MTRTTGTSRRSTRAFRTGALVALLLLLALPAEARRHHKRKAPLRPPPARAEDDPRKKGDDKAFAKAAIKFKAPEDLAQLEAGKPVNIELAVAGYAIGPPHKEPQRPPEGSEPQPPAPQTPGPVPHLHVIVDNEPAFEAADLSEPLTLTGLAPGPHLLRAVLCRPWHEVVKAPKAFAMVRFWVGPKLPGKAGKAAEYVAWPDPKKPILTYVLPIGTPSKDAPKLDLQGAADPPPGDRPVLDFYLANAKLARRGDKIRIVLDRRELPLITEWKPQHLRRARSGVHKLTIDILSRKGLKVKNAVNRTDRVFTARPMQP